jgi:hypothetical protein
MDMIIFRKFTTNTPTLFGLGWAGLGLSLALPIKIQNTIMLSERLGYNYSK